MQNQLEVARRAPDDVRVPLHDADGFAAMHRAGQLAAEVLDMITPHVQPG